MLIVGSLLFWLGRVSNDAGQSVIRNQAELEAPRPADSAEGVGPCIGSDAERRRGSLEFVEKRDRQGSIVAESLAVDG